MANYRLFIEKAPSIMDALKRDFHFTTVQTAAVLGNTGHECNGFHTMQEVHPIAGRGGYGWEQWTGPRRRAFEAWCSRQHLDIDSDQANYGFLKHELSTTHDYASRALLRETDLVRAVRVFERKYLVAGVPNYPSRERYAQVALDAYRAHAGATEGLAMKSVADPAAAAWLDDGLDTLRELATTSQLGADSYIGQVYGAKPDCGCHGTTQLMESAGLELAPASMLELAAAPVIHDTASWGAHPPKSAIAVLNRRPKGIVIHHTASANVADTSLVHAKQLARNIQSFHMGPQRNWKDTGQHFTVSRGGHMLEGRHRSLEIARAGQKHVLGAHAGDACNSDYVGIENEGTYMVGLPPAAQWTALVQLCAWLCNQYGMSTADIIGHRQCKSTDCPGDRFFGQLSKLRNDVDAAR
ncbi:phage tail tip lysozyme [Mesorhizobium sp. M0924]|uniref:phage tail tip lysozyme n=1 Tax=unclassified Mesorhizobium TaxID=325217 RepID=UPI00333728D8